MIQTPYVICDFFSFSFTSPFQLLNSPNITKHDTTSRSIVPVSANNKPPWEIWLLENESINTSYVWNLFAIRSQRIEPKKKKNGKKISKRICARKSLRASIVLRPLSLCIKFAYSFARFTSRPLVLRLPLAIEPVIHIDSLQSRCSNLPANLLVARTTVVCARPRQPLAIGCLPFTVINLN